MTAHSNPVKKGAALGSQDRTAPLIERAPLPMMEVEGREHVVCYANASFCLLLKKSREELVGKSFSQIVPSGDKCVPLLDRIYQTGEFETHVEPDASNPAHWLYAMWPVLDTDKKTVRVVIQLTKAAHSHQNVATMNEALLIGALRQHELTEAAEQVSSQLRAEIADRQQTEGKLRMSELEAKSALEYAAATLRTAPIPLLVLRADLRVNTANEAFYKNFQVAPAETEGALIYDLGNRQWNIPKLRELLEEILPKNNFFEGFELTHVFESIGRRTMLLNARRMENEIGQPLHIVLAIEDITERKLAEERLHLSELEAKRALDYAEATLRTAPIPLLVLRADLRVNTANEAFYENFQVAPGETEGALIYDLGNRQWNIPELRELLEEILPKNNFFDGFEITHEFESIGRRTMLLNARRMENEAGQPLRIVLAIEDITKRKHAEERLRVSEERLRFMAESMPQKIFTAIPGGEIDYFNQRWMEFTGLPFDQIKNWGWPQFVHPDDVEKNVSQWKHSVQTGDYFELEHRVRRHDGVFRWQLTRAHAMRDAQGKVMMWIGSTTDVDDARRTMEEIARTVRAKDDFLAALSHELRTPLTPVLLTTALLREDHRLPRDVREQLGMMERNIALEARLIDDLLDLTKISHGKLQLRVQSCDAHYLIGLAVEIVREDAHAKEISIECSLTAPHSGLAADPTRFQQVIWNLLRNAVKFTPRGGIVSIRTHDEAAANGQVWLQIEVADSGIGIAPAQLEQIFLPFDQGGLVGDHRFGGLGLGLAIARAVVSAHGGRISAESAGTGRGATFIVAFPGAVEPPTRVTASPILPASSEASTAQLKAPVTIAPLRLLVVEDHASTLLTLSRLLQRDGHHVVAAPTMADALAAAELNAFDLVISDLGLPDGSGIELMEKLRSSHGLRGVALSGYGTEEDILRTRTAGFVAHVVKPVAIAELRRVIAELPVVEN